MIDTYDFGGTREDRWETETDKRKDFTQGTVEIVAFTATGCGHLPTWKALKEEVTNSWRMGL